MTVLLVTHEPDDARRLATRIVFLEAGEVVADAATDSFFGPDSPEAFRRYVGGDRA
jgi:thiamine transport system ATP-binding protein